MPVLTMLPRNVPLLSATCPTSKFSTKLGPLGELIAPLLMMFPEKVPPLPMASKLMAMAVSFVAVRAPPLLLLPENSAAPTFSM